MRRYTVQPAEEGKRLREILRGGMSVSWSAMKSAKWNGEILLNGERSFTDVRVRAGDLVEIVFPEKAPVYRPVNRLDKGTSGLMVVAKDGHVQDLLQRRLHSDAFLREYLALTEGVPDPPEGVIDAPVGKTDAASVKREVRPDGKPARTRYRVEEIRGSRALVRLRLETGRTHQIRVHLAHIGCPVCGDFLYGTELPEEFPRRFALHSAFLSFLHPVSGRPVRLESIPSWAALS